MIIPRTPETTLRISVPPFLFTLRIHGGSVRTRRTLALVLFQAVKPVFRMIKYCQIDHADAYPMAMRTEDRLIPPERREISIRTDRGKLGFVVRMRRLALGLTQKELASRLGMNPCHLCEIERGRIAPRMKTRFRLERILGIPLPLPEIKAKPKPKFGVSGPRDTQAP